jgi:hypothetical protein
VDPPPEPEPPVDPVVEFEDEPQLVSHRAMAASATYINNLKKDRDIVEDLSQNMS